MLKCTKINWSLQRSPDPLAGFKGPISKGNGWEGRREGGSGLERERHSGTSHFTI